MKPHTSFPERIRTAYPDGLTGIFAIGGTRTTYILENATADKNDPGKIQDFGDYAQHTKQKHMDLISSFIKLGGQNIIIPTLAYQRFANYSIEYVANMSEYALELIGSDMLDFYSKNNIDPYFIGIDTLAKLPTSNPGHKLGLRLSQFQSTYTYDDNRYKLIWEIAPIPLFSIFNADKVLGHNVWEEFKTELESVDNLISMHQLLYQCYCKAVIGTVIPYPHLYVGTNRNGDLKLRSMIPMSLFSGEDFRMYFLPYPTFFITEETLRTILEDMTFGERMRSFDKDYSGKYDTALIQSEYDRMMSLASDPLSTIGLSRQQSTHSDK